MALSTSAPALIHGIIPRSFSPTSSIGCSSASLRIALKLDAPDRYSCIHLLVKRKDRKKGVLMLVAAAVALGNVLVWTL